MNRRAAAMVFLEALECDGIRFRVMGGRIQWCPSTALRESEEALLRELKPEVLEMLPLGPLERDLLAFHPAGMTRPLLPARGQEPKKSGAA